MDLIFLLGAEVEIQSAFARFEEMQEGRGRVFMQCLDAALTLLRNNPRVGPAYEGPYRRLLVRRFPFGIFYQLQQSRIVVAAVMDVRRDPAAIRARLFGA
jgi:plasmid stabilization system protein ParE